MLGYHGRAGCGTLRESGALREMTLKGYSLSWILQDKTIPRLEIPSLLKCRRSPRRKDDLLSTVSNNITRAIILAAGRGSRMQRHTLNQPKCLIEIKGKTLLMRQLEAIKKVGIKEVAIVTGYQSGRLKEYGNLQFHNSRWARTNMVFSLFLQS